MVRSAVRRGQVRSGGVRTIDRPAVAAAKQGASRRGQGGELATPSTVAAPAAYLLGVAPWFRVKRAPNMTPRRPGGQPPQLGL